MKLRALSTTKLRRELERRERGSKSLLAKRRKLAERLAAIDAALADLGTEGAVKLRGRAALLKRGRRFADRRNVMSGHGRATSTLTLREAILKGVRIGATVSPLEAGAAAKAAGYQSTSNTFGVMVATCLANAKEFRRKGRGAYLRLAGSRWPTSTQRTRASR